MTKLNKRVMDLTREVMREFAIGEARYDKGEYYRDPEEAYHLSFGLADEPIAQLWERLSWGNGSGNVFIRDKTGLISTFTVTLTLQPGKYVGEPGDYRKLTKNAPLGDLLKVLRQLEITEVLQRSAVAGERPAYLSQARTFPLTLADKV